MTPRTALRVPAAVAFVTLSATAIGGCGPETCYHTFFADGAATSTSCVDDAGCYTYRDDAGQPLFTDCPVADACTSVRTYPDGATGRGGNYC